MTMCRSALAAAFACIMALPLGNAFAHRMNSAMSLIEVSPTSGRLQISHRLFAHDLEGALGAGSVELTWFDTPQGKAALRAYCLEKFALKGAGNRPIALTFVGIEVDGGLINVYFEGPRPTGKTLTVDSNFLHETSQNQVNQVNVRANGRTVSAVFHDGSAAKSMVLP